MNEAIRNAQRGLGLSRARLESLIERAGKLQEKLDAEMSLLQSMECLAAQARTAASPSQRPDLVERQDDGTFLASDGWEIALIGEDGRW